MYGENITLSNGDQSVTVFVLGTPKLSKKEWEKRAKELIKGMRIVD